MCKFIFLVLFLEKKEKILNRIFKMGGMKKEEEMSTISAIHDTHSKH